MSEKIIEGVVVKVTKDYCVLLCEDGTFKNVPRQKGEVPLLGNSFSYKEQKRTGVFATSLKGISVLAMAAVLFIAVLLSGVTKSQAEYAYVVAIDINPSIELHLDEDFEVVEVVPLNEDGEKIVALINVEGDLYRITKSIISESINQGYLTSNEAGAVNTTIIDLENTKQMPSETQLQKVISEELVQHDIAATVEIFQESKDYYEIAKKENLSVNQFRKFQDMAANGFVEEKHVMEEKSILDEEEKQQDQTNVETKSGENSNASTPELPDAATSHREEPDQNQQKNKPNNQNATNKEQKNKKNQNKQEPSPEKRQNEPEEQGNQPEANTNEEPDERSPETNGKTNGGKPDVTVQPKTDKGKPKEVDDESKSDKERLNIPEEGAKPEPLGRE